MRGSNSIKAVILVGGTENVGENDEQSAKARANGNEVLAGGGIKELVILDFLGVGSINIKGYAVYGELRGLYDIETILIF